MRDSRSSSNKIFSASKAVITVTGTKLSHVKKLLGNSILLKNIRGNTLETNVTIPVPQTVIINTSSL